MGAILEREFFAQDATAVARALLGAVLVRRIDGQRVSGRIVEVEAYRTPDDQACHARSGKTARNMPMESTGGGADSRPGTARWAECHRGPASRSPVPRVGERAGALDARAWHHRRR